MKSFYLIIVCFALIQCTSSEKTTESLTEQDSLASLTDSLANDSLLTDTPTAIVTDSASGFNELNYASYFVLSNYSEDLSGVNEADVQTIAKPCAVIVSPTDEQMENLEKKAGEDFETVMDDAMYYQGMAIEMLDSIDIETVTLEKRYLRFKYTGGQEWTLDMRKNGAPEWNMVFFKPGKEPMIVSSIEMTHERISAYFK